MAKTGIWSNPSDRILPGIYNRFVGVANTYGEGLVGTIGIPVRANWGEVGKVVTIRNNIVELKEAFGDDVGENYSAFKLASLLLKTNVKYIKLYRLADSSAAKATVSLKNSNESATNIIELSSKYPTSKDLNVTIKNNVTDKSAVEMYIYEGTKLLVKIYNIRGKVDEMVNAINTAYENKYVVAKKLAESTDRLAECVNTKLTGGNDGCSSITNQQYIDALDAFEREKIDGFALDGKEDEALDTAVFEWIKKNYESGRVIQYFAGTKKSEDITQACARARKVNNKLYTLVASSGVLDGVEYSACETAAYICAEEICNKLKECSTNKETVFDTVKKVFTNTELEEAERAGVLVLDIDDDKVVIVDDVNTYKQYPADTSDNESINGFNRTVRTIKAINEMLITAGKGVVGKVDSDPEIGYDIIISAFKKGFEHLVSEGALRSFTVAVDKERQEVARTDEFFFVWNAIRNDKVKRIYGTGTLR